MILISGQTTRRVGEWFWCPRFQNRDSTIAAHLLPPFPPNPTRSHSGGSGARLPPHLLPSGLID